LSINTSFDKFDKRAFDPNAKSIPCLALGVSLVGRPSLALVLVSLGKGYQIGLMYTLNKLRRCRHRARRNRQAFAYFSWSIPCFLLQVFTSTGEVNVSYWLDCLPVTVDNGSNCNFYHFLKLSVSRNSLELLITSKNPRFVNRGKSKSTARVFLPATPFERVGTHWNRD
jgi:hypothetical protein